MKKILCIIITTVWILNLIPVGVQAQDDLLKMLEQESAKQKTTDYAYATFKGTHLINGQSVETTAGGVLNVIFSHRFGKINDGAYQFFGLDQATVRLGMEYGLTDWLNVGIGRSSYQKTVDGYVKMRLMRQSSGLKRFPFTVVYYGNLAINGLKWANPERINYFSSRLYFANQIMIARKFNNNFSLQLSPTVVHKNLVVNATDPNDIFAVGIGGRYKITNRMSLTGEYYYQLPVANATNLNYNSLAFGIDIETGGHVFQIQVTNAQSMIEQYFIPETMGNFFNGDLYFGFNISRVFTIKNKK